MGACVCVCDLLNVVVWFAVFVLCCVCVLFYVLVCLCVSYCAMLNYMLSFVCVFVYARVFVLRFVCGINLMCLYVVILMCCVMAHGFC